VASGTRSDPDPASPSSPIRFSVVVPTRGREELLIPLLDALEAQTLPRDRWEIVLSFDGCAPSGRLAARIAAMGAKVVVSPSRGGPGAARNRGAAIARGDWLAFTEDDCVPAPDWLAAAAARMDRAPRLEAVEGATLLPDGRDARRRDGARPTWLPTNLFVRRTRFEGIGGYCERYFNPRSGVYFREDSDFGFALGTTGAPVAVEAAARVTHPREHRGWLDPIRWARRYEMDPLLAARHPEAFREEIEVVRWGPIRMRRPFVRVCVGYVLALLAAAAAAAIGEAGVAAWFVGVAAIAAAVLWAKWRFDPRKLPAVLLVPPVLLAALLRGAVRYRVASRTTR
jgi:glycosyltransferase involved in cell wall biosynthesis